jgi:hypothetical protein
VRERMAEVLDSHPVSNDEYVLGKSLGLLFMVMIVVLLVLLGFQSLGLLAQLFDWRVGEYIEPVSVLGFFIQAATTLALWTSIIILTAVVFRHRLLVAIIALAFMGLQGWLLAQLPVYLIPIFSMLPNFDLASDMLPSLMRDGGLLSLINRWVLTAALLILAIALHPRLDGGSRKAKLMLGSGLLALAVVIGAGQFWQATAAIQQQEDWLTLHRAHQDDSRLDMTRLSGVVSIRPGDEIDLDLHIHGSAPGQDQLVFTLNPGLEIEQVTINDEPATFVHAGGLLTITTPLRGTLEIGIKAAGMPDRGFGYLDSAIHPQRVGTAGGHLSLLGVDVSLNESGYVALMPGGFWLPRPGPAVPGDDTRTHAEDFFDLDLTVEIPADWLVAGPGRREEVARNGDTVRYRFRPGAPLSQVGLVAAQFDRYATELEGTEIEMLVYPGHARNVRFFTDAAPEIEARMGDVLRAARNYGLPYPYGGLSLVEIPNRLRGFGGDWRMDTVLTMPGVLLMRENGFPTSRFEIGLDDPTQFDSDDDRLAAKVKTVEQYFENDVNGGNILTGAARQFLRFHTSATGREALAVNFVLDELVSRLLMDRQGYFSAHELAGTANLMIGVTMQQVVQGRSGDVIQAITDATTGRASVWDRALGSALVDLDTAKDPKQAVNVVALKGHEVAESILDGVGREQTAALLAALSARFSGRSFDYADIQVVARDLDINLEALLGDWLGSVALPGFVTSAVTTRRLTDDALGNPRYQTLVQVRNSEAVPGLFKLNYGWGNKKDNFHDKTAPVRLGANESKEVGIVTGTPLLDLTLDGYLCLNRRPVVLSLPRVESVERVPGESFVGARSSDWRPLETADIIVDDLDPGFSVEAGQSADAGVPFFLTMQGFQIDMDQGLPTAINPFGAPRVWSRGTAPESYGKYRHTYAIVAKGDGSQRAQFAAEVRRAGRYRVAWHVLGTEKKAPSGGHYDITLVTAGETHKIDFDSAAAQAGWNDLGEFELGAGEVLLKVTNTTGGASVIADAIRLRPMTNQAASL